MMLHEKLKTLHFPFLKTYKDQTCHIGDLNWEVFAYQVTFPFDIVITWYHVIGQERYISTSTRSTSIKHGTVKN